MDTIKITHFDTAMVLLEIGSIRILTDPVFDKAGHYYNFNPILGSSKLSEVVRPADQIGEIDAVLLSHDEHADNLDIEGRKFLPKAGKVLTTLSGSKR